jgi:hypothetical protein
VKTVRVAGRLTADRKDERTTARPPRRVGDQGRYEPRPVAPGLPPRGETFAASQTHWFRVADGRLREDWATHDDLTAWCSSESSAPRVGLRSRADVPIALAFRSVDRQHVLMRGACSRSPWAAWVGAR